jgi:hypothetical protein
MRFTPRQTIEAVAAFLIVVASCVSSHAQLNQGSLAGHVVDPSGAVNRTRSDFGQKRGYWDCCIRRVDGCR